MAKVKVDFFSKQIMVSASFHRKAMNSNSAEYYELQAICNRNPGFAVTIRPFNKNSNQQHYSGLTYDYMRWYIKKYDSCNKTRQLKELDRMIDISRCQSQCYRYPVIKAWFLREYPEIADFGMIPIEEDGSEDLKKPEAAQSETVEPAAA